MAVEVVDDFVEFGCDVRVGDGECADLGEGFSAFFDFVLFDKPAGGFVLEDDAEEEEGAWEHLEGEGDAPLV